MPQPQINPKIIILIGVIDVSFAAIFIRLLQDNFGTPFLIIAFYRLVFTIVILAPIFVYLKGWQCLREVGNNTLVKIIGAGVMLSLHFALWILSLEETSIASSIIIVNTGALFGVVFAYLFLKERLNRYRILGIIIAFVGVCVIATADWTYNTAILGDLLALFSAITFGFYLIAGRHVRQQLALIPYVFLLYSTCALSLFVMCLAWQYPLFPYSGGEIMLFMALAIVPTIFGHTLYNWALKYVDTAIVGVALFGEPIGSILLGFLILGEVPHLIVIVGGVLVLIGVYITLFFEN